MKNTFKNIALAALVALSGVILTNAQTPYATTGNSSGNAGTVNFSIVVPKAADLRTGGAANFSNTAAINATAASATNDALSVSIAVSDASPNQTNGISAANPNMWADVPIRMRSNATYEIYAFRDDASATALLNSPATGDMGAADVGFAVTGLGTRTAGGLLNAGTDAAQGTFGTSQKTKAGLNGQSNFDNDLADIATTTAGTKIAGGPRISLGGDNTSTDNFITANLEFSIRPQYYTPKTYTTVVKAYIVTP